MSDENKSYIYTIGNSNGRTGGAWNTEYTSVASAAAAIMRAYAWDDAVSGPWFQSRHNADAEFCHVAESQADIDRDENGESPWITRTTRS